LYFDYRPPQKNILEALIIGEALPIKRVVLRSGAYYPIKPLITFLLSYMYKRSFQTNEIMHHIAGAA